MCLWNWRNTGYPSTNHLKGSIKTKGSQSYWQITRKEKYVYYKLRENNETLKNIIADIALNLEEEYPQLLKDYKNISTKWKYSGTPTAIDSSILT